MLRHTRRLVCVSGFSFVLFSFWDGPLKETDNAQLLRAEQQDLLADLRALPRNSTVRKINELVKRARMAKVHAHLLNHMRGKFGMFGKKKDQTKMLQDEQLAEIFRTVQQTANLPQGDFPSMKLFREKVEKYEIWKFPKLDKKLVTQMEEVLSRDIPALMRHLPQEDAAKFKGSATRSAARRHRCRCMRARERRRCKDRQDRQTRADAPFFFIFFFSAAPVFPLIPRSSEHVQQMEVNPFAPDPDREEIHSGWAISTAMKKRYDNEFFALDLGPDEKASGAAAKKYFLKSKLDAKVLRVIWDLYAHAEAHSTSQHSGPCCATPDGGAGHCSSLTSVDVFFLLIAIPSVQCRHRPRRCLGRQRICRRRLPHRAGAVRRRVAVRTAGRRRAAEQEKVKGRRGRKKQ